MKLDAVTRQSAGGGFGGRFYLVGYLPTYAAALFLLVLVWAGALGPASRPSQQDQLHGRVGDGVSSEPR